MALLVVEDVQGHWPGKPESYRDQFMEWMREHGMEPDQTKRIEVHLVDAPYAVVTRYDVDEWGRTRIDREREEYVMRRDTVMLRSLPPGVDPTLAP